MRDRFAQIRWNQVLIAFLIGCLTTAAVLHCKRKSWHKWGGPSRFERMLDQFSAELQLTADQKAKVAVIFEAKRRAVEALRAEVRPRFQEIHKNAVAEIRPLLTPEQQEKLDVMETRREEERRRWRERRGHSSPKPPAE